MQAATPRIGATGDREQVFHAAIGRVEVRIAKLVKEERETSFAHRAVGQDEIWDGVGAAIHEPVGDHLALGVQGRAGSARGRWFRPWPVESDMSRTSPG